MTRPGLVWFDPINLLVWVFELGLLVCSCVNWQILWSTDLVVDFWRSWIWN